MPRTLYDYQTANVRKTWLLITVFLIVVIGLGWIFSYMFNSPMILYLAVGLSLVMNAVGYWKSDSIALAISRARPITRDQAREFFRIVENLTIASGLPMPRLYLIEAPQINAFATGRNPEHSAIAVTTGALAKLEKVELEGVLAHELSHIRNRDILVSSLVVVLAGVIALLADFLLRATLFGGLRRRNDRGGGGAIMLIITLAVIIIAPLVATIIRLAISRKREYLADSSGALLTRYPEGLSRALDKIAHDTGRMRGASNATAHLFLASPFKGKEEKSWFSKLFMTHPPIDKRIKILQGMRV